MNADYALMKSIQPYANHPYLLVSYDIACQYSKNIVQCFMNKFPNQPELAQAMQRAIFAVPKLHVQGHKDDCQYRYSLNFIEGARRMAGELIETAWAHANKDGPSTCEMNPGHQHDVLNDVYGFWNWLKTIKICMSLALECVICTGRVLVARQQ